MTADEIYSLIQPDMNRVNARIQEKLHSEVVLINQIGTYIINSGGKRLRPIIHLISARAFGYDGDRHIDLAAIVEFIHTATLLHDDVVDASELRRGEATANHLWGNEASVLVGDFLYSRAFQMMVDIGSMKVMDILADATNTIAEGEVLQLLNCHDPDTSEERYLEVIHNKTAKLFESAARLGAVISERDEAEEAAMTAYGMHLGCTFQLIDDVLDYTAESSELGKNVGDDLAEGKPTLPLIHAMREGNPAQRDRIRGAIEKGGLEQIGEILAAIESTGAIDYTARCAQAEADRAIEAIADLPGSRYRDALIGLARFAVDRRY